MLDTEIIEKPKVLAVDDEDRNLRLMEAMLLPLGYEVDLAHDGEEALNKVSSIAPDVILLDIMMPGINGFEVARRLKSDDETRLIPIIMVTALKEVEDRVKGLDAGADDFLTKPVDKMELKARVASSLKVKAYNDHMRNYQKKLEREIERRTAELERAYARVRDASLDTIHRLSRAAEYKDEHTGDHIQRMSRYCVAIGRKLGLSQKVLDSILYAAPMHDIGKIGIPDKILLKPRRLKPEEWQIMKRHTNIGAEILQGSDVGFIRLAEVIAMTHHERWDGNGYPHGISGKEIPLVGRICAVADVFDALTSRRPYKEPISVEDSCAIIMEGRGIRFDPKVVDAFFAAMDEIMIIKDQFPDTTRSRLVEMVGIGD
ncbi:MAG: HD domain-containing phosphohydrolase [Thermodesulfobacteriota bacterium]